MDILFLFFVTLKLNTLKREQCEITNFCLFLGHPTTNRFLLALLPTKCSFNFPLSSLILCFLPFPPRTFKLQKLSILQSSASVLFCPYFQTCTFKPITERNLVTKSYIILHKQKKVYLLTNPPRGDGHLEIILFSLTVRGNVPCSTNIINVLTK